MSVNKVILVGRLGRDPETRFTGAGQAVCNFSLATDETFKDRNGERQKRTEWHKIVVWGKQAEIAQQYLKKGSKVYVEGRIQNRTWDAQDGTKKNRTEIVIDNMIMLDSKGSGMGSGAGNQGFAAGNAAPSPAQKSEFENSLNEIPTINQEQPADEEISVEDIPF